MSAAGWAQFVAFVALVLVTAVPLGRYLALVYGDRDGDGRPPGDRFFSRVERGVYRVCGVDPSREQRWTVYAYSLIGFSLVSVLVLYAIQRIQGATPVNPTGVGGVIPHLSFNTAVSFVTNTNWRSYGT